FESQRLAVGAGPGSPARSDEVSGREVEGGTCGTAADAGWRVGPHLGGSGEPGIAARTEARYCRGVAQGQEGPSQPGAAGGERPCPTGGAGGSSTEGAAARALVRIRDRYRERRAWEDQPGIARPSGKALPVGADAPWPA